MPSPVTTSSAVLGRAGCGCSLSLSSLLALDVLQHHRALEPPEAAADGQHRVDDAPARPADVVQIACGVGFVQVRGGRDHPSLMVVGSRLSRATDRAEGVPDHGFEAAHRVLYALLPKLSLNAAVSCTSSVWVPTVCVDVVDLGGSDAGVLHGRVNGVGHVFAFWVQPVSGSVAAEEKPPISRDLRAPPQGVSSSSSTRMAPLAGTRPSRVRRRGDSRGWHRHWVLVAGSRRSTRR